jgi:acetyltransferase
MRSRPNPTHLAARETPGRSADEPTTSSDGRPHRVPALDGFRAYALLAIVLVHLIGASGILPEISGTTQGVVLWSVFGNSIDAFFMISGFVLFLPTIVRRGEFGTAAAFWVARGARLLPAYWLVMALALLALALVPPESVYPVPPLESVLAHLTVMQTPIRLFDPGVSPGFGIVGPVWMVSVVVCFYILLPFVARPYYRHPLIGLAVAAAITAGWKGAVSRVPQAFEAVSDGSISDLTVRLIAVDQFPGWAFSFGLGLTGAWAYVRLRERYEPGQLSRAALRLAPVIVLLYAYGAYLYGNTTLVYPGRIGPAARSEALDTMFGSLSKAALIGIVILGPIWMQRPFVNRITSRLAELSYGVYLIHIPLVIYAASVLGLPRDGSLWALAVWIAVIVPPSLLFAALSRRYVERPILEWVKWRLLPSAQRRDPLASPG